MKFDLKEFTPACQGDREERERTEKIRIHKKIQVDLKEYTPACLPRQGQSFVGKIGNAVGKVNKTRKLGDAEPRCRCLKIPKIHEMLNVN